MAAIQQALQALGYTQAVSSSIMHPGAERTRLLEFLLGKLLHPASLENVLSKLALEDASSAMLSEDEKLAHKYSVLLRSLGFSASPDLVRGNVSLDTNTDFLVRLTNLVHMQQQLQAPPARPASEDGEPQQQHQTGSISSASLPAQSKLLEFACERMPALTAEAVPLFPSDITKALQPFSSHAESLLNNSSQWTQNLQQQGAQLQQQVQELESQLSISSDAEWQKGHEEVQRAMAGFLGSVREFTDVYNKELGVWCEQSQGPATHGFGQQAATILAIYDKLRAVLHSMAVIKQMHAALSSSAPPLQAYQPQELSRIAAQGQAEVARLAQEVAVLRRAAARQTAGTRV